MKTSTKVLHTENKIAKNGNKYRLVHLLIILDGQEFVRKFALFGQSRELDIQSSK